jgi:hypothetical protein
VTTGCFRDAEFSVRFPAMNPNRRPAFPCPFRSSRFPDTGRSAKPGVFEVECSEPAIRDLTHSANCRPSYLPESRRPNVQYTSEPAKVAIHTSRPYVELHIRPRCTPSAFGLYDCSAQLAVAELPRR